MASLTLETEVSSVDFNWAPNGSRRTEPRVITNRFGDGFEQRIKDGINNIPRIYSLKLEALTEDEYDELDEFLKARYGVEAFNFSPPSYESDAGATIAVKCAEWTPTYLRGGHVDIEVEFEEVFEA